MVLKTVDSFVEMAIKKLEEGRQIETLKNCSSVMERLEKLMDLSPGMMFGNIISARKFVYELHRRYQIDLGVCEYYSLEGDTQFCTATGKKIMCLCAIPESYCVVRDAGSGPRYPEFAFVSLLEKLNERQSSSA
jgi:hypothetical protein